MGRGRKPQRGGRRQFTDMETLQKEAEEEKRKLRKEENSSSEEDEEEEKIVVNRQGAVGELPPSESDSDSESESQKTKASVTTGSSNKQPVKNKKIDSLTLESLEVNDDKRGMNRKEREAIAQEEAKRRFQAATAAGKTDLARADLARLAIIRKEREEAAKRRAEEQKAKEAASKAKAETRAKAQGKR